jgi:hypothetical protein
VPFASSAAGAKWWGGPRRMVLSRTIGGEAAVAIPGRAGTRQPEKTNTIAGSEFHHHRDKMSRRRQAFGPRPLACARLGHDHMVSLAAGRNAAGVAGLPAPVAQRGHARHTLVTVLSETFASGPTTSADAVADLVERAFLMSRRINSPGARARSGATWLCGAFAVKRNRARLLWP